MRHTPRSSLALATLAFAFSWPAFADEPPPSPPSPPSTTTARTRSPPARAPISATRKALAAGAAVFPGALAHGAGHFVIGQPQTGFRLLALEGVGLGVTVGGIAAIAATGASRRFIGPLIAGTVSGVGLFIIPALADLYGVLAPEGGTGSPPRAMPWLETQAGFRYVYDPTFAYRAFLVQGVDLRWRPFRLSSSAWFALDDANARIRTLGAFRFFGPETRDGAPAKDGSFLDIEGGFTHHRYASNGFSIGTFELSLQGRLDLGRIGPTLRGSFAEMEWGFALETYRYHALAAPPELGELLLARFAFGAYLGHQGYPRGEAMVFYNHRRDGFVGGLKFPGVGAGVPGHFGLEGRMYLSPRWGLLLDMRVGSAYIGGLSLLFRYGGNP